MRHHAFVVVGESEGGIAFARDFAKKELKLLGPTNPDIVLLQYGLLSVEDSRKIISFAAQAPFAGAYKVIIITAARLYHEAQNALLKLFEEPPQGTYLFLVVPNAGAILSTLRSRVSVVRLDASAAKEPHPLTTAFIKSSKDKRTALIKKLTSAKDEDARREARDEALSLVNGLEEALFANGALTAEGVAYARDLALFRAYLYDRSAPVKMMLEHRSLTIPKSIAK